MIKVTMSNLCGHDNHHYLMATTIIISWPRVYFLVGTRGHTLFSSISPGGFCRDEYFSYLKKMYANDELIKCQQIASIWLAR